jgi:predicted AAA+ superfamily ATPase
MWIKRTFEDILIDLAKKRPAIVLTGARQTGKTSILKRIFPDHHFVTLDLPEEAFEAEKEPKLFFKRNSPPVLVDEVQFAPELFRYIKIEIDQHRQRYGSFILTGSQKFLLMKGVADSLAGRVSVLELEGLSYTEIRDSYKNRILPFDVPTLFMRGGFPELYANLDLDAFDFFRSYLATYLQRDVRALLNVGSLRDFERFLRACALRSAQVLNKSDLARDVGISPSTANEWLSVLSASNQIVLLEPWFSNSSKSITKSPKLYLTDVGMMVYLLNLKTEEQILSSPYIGAIWETFVFSELRKRQTALEGSWSIFYWRDRSKEVDFLIHRGGIFELLEAKWTEYPTGRDTEGLTHVSQMLESKNGQRVASKKIVCRTRQSFPISNGVRCLGLEDDWVKTF